MAYGEMVFFFFHLFATRYDQRRMTFLIEACLIEDGRVDSLGKTTRTTRQAPQKSRSYQIETSCLVLSIVSLTPILVRASPLSRWISTVTSGRSSGKKLSWPPSSPRYCLHDERSPFATSLTMVTLLYTHDR